MRLPNGTHLIGRRLVCKCVRTSRRQEDSGRCYRAVYVPRLVSYEKRISWRQSGVTVITTEHPLFVSNGLKARTSLRGAVLSTAQPYRQVTKTCVCVRAQNYACRRAPPSRDSRSRTQGPVSLIALYPSCYHRLRAVTV